MDTLERAKNLFLHALEHHNRNRWQEAETLYRQAHALLPDRLSVSGNLAAVLAAQGRYTEARKFCDLVLSVEPDHFDCLMVLASCTSEEGNWESALQLLQRLAALRPDHVEVHSNLGVLLGYLQRSDEALRSFDRALTLDPAHLGVLVNRSKELAALGRYFDALACLERALIIDPEFVRAHAGFIDLVNNHQFVGTGAAFEGLAIRAISAPWCRPQAMAQVLIRTLWLDSTFREWIGAAASAWPTRVSLDGFPWSKVVSNRLLLALLGHVPITHVPLEQLLTTLRLRLFSDAVDGYGEPNAQRLTFHCALARQCFINEYVYDEDLSEAANVRALQAACEAALSADKPIPVAWLPALATYIPLFSLRGADRLLSRQWPDDIKLLCEQQVRNPLIERNCRAEIPRLTNIEDSTSKEVRKQYEENPYPRWVGSARPLQRQTLDAYLLRRFPGSLYRSFPTGPAIAALNAGCGTGQHPIETALRFSNIEVLAVDLSLTSLAYATRMATLAGANNIHFAQADILELASLERRFDFIESDGVLHHLREPARGLAVLQSLLAKNGVMKLAFYSELARQPVVAARTLIQAAQYTANAHDIRRCRHDIMELNDQRIERQLLEVADFYTLSECRDLLFHVQEHRFDIPGIQRMLDPLNLEFIGFELTPQQLARFREAFPRDSSLYSLSDWHDYEMRNPEFFVGMYQFWVQCRCVEAA